MKKTFLAVALGPKGGVNLTCASGGKETREEAQEWASAQLSTNGLIPGVIIFEAVEFVAYERLPVKVTPILAEAA